MMRIKVADYEVSISLLTTHVKFANQQGRKTCKTRLAPARVALPPSDWEPELTTLDAVIGSLQFGEYAK